eukprot:4859533-Pleurochrysis_carterae.AAC.5
MARCASMRLNSILIGGMAVRDIQVLDIMDSAPMCKRVPQDCRESPGRHCFLSKGGARLADVLSSKVAGCSCCRKAGSDERRGEDTTLSCLIVCAGAGHARVLFITSSPFRWRPSLAHVTKGKGNQPAVSATFIRVEARTDIDISAKIRTAHQGFADCLCQVHGHSSSDLARGLIHHHNHDVRLAALASALISKMIQLWNLFSVAPLQRAEAALLRLDARPCLGRARELKTDDEDMARTWRRRRVTTVQVTAIDESMQRRKYSQLREPKEPN